MLQIDFGRDFERQLDSYVDARSSFSNLESVLVMLVQVVADKQLWLLRVEVPGWLRSCLTFFFWTECELAGHEDSPSSKRKSYSKNLLIYQGKNAVFISKSSEAWPGQTVQNILNLILKFLVHVLISWTIVFLTEVFKFASPSVNMVYSTAMAIISGFRGGA